MAQPKRRWSKARTGLRRSTWKVDAPAYVECPHCHEPILPHRVCKNCGYYDGKEVIKVEEKEKAAK
jgi:large subunit ribosomal protein L32